jgi:hypothetical protein
VTKSSTEGARTTRITARSVHCRPKTSDYEDGSPRCRWNTELKIGGYEDDDDGKQQTHRSHPALFFYYSLVPDAYGSLTRVLFRVSAGLGAAEIAASEVLSRSSMTQLALPLRRSFPASWANLLVSRKINMVRCKTVGLGTRMLEQRFVLRNEHLASAP